MTLDPQNVLENRSTHLYCISEQISVLRNGDADDCARKESATRLVMPGSSIQPSISCCQKLKKRPEQPVAAGGLIWAHAQYSTAIARKAEHKSSYGNTKEALPFSLYGCQAQSHEVRFLYIEVAKTAKSQKLLCTS